MADQPLPQLGDSGMFLTDGGLETTLLFVDGIDLPEFAAFPLLETEDGRAALDRYFAPYLDLAERRGAGFVLGAPTWRANPDWGRVLGYDETSLAAVNRRAADYLADLAARWPGVTTVREGMVGPRGDGYVVGEAMSADEATEYHGLQARAFAESGVPYMSGLTMTYAAEAIGVVQAAREAGIGAVASFTVETDGRLPSGQSLPEAVTEVDEATDGAAAYFMVNCAHPTHFAAVLDEDGAWLGRIKGIRANASTKSHAELDEATELDRGDIPALAAGYRRLSDALPDLRVVGGCCGTDAEHVTAIAEELVTRG